MYTIPVPLHLPVDLYMYLWPIVCANRSIHAPVPLYLPEGIKGPSLPMFVTFNKSVVKDDHKNQQGFIVFHDTLRKKYFMRKNFETFTKYELFNSSKKLWFIFYFHICWICNKKKESKLIKPSFAVIFTEKHCLIIC